MADLLIRDVDEADVRKIDAFAARLGISRSELLRREVRNLARRSGAQVSRVDFERSAEIFADALDEEIMRQAWR